MSISNEWQRIPPLNNPTPNTNTMTKSIGLLAVTLMLALLSCGDQESKEAAVAPVEKPLNVFYVRTSPLTQSGINEVIFLSDKYQGNDIFKASKIMLDTAGVKYRKVETHVSSIELSFDESKV